MQRKALIGALASIMLISLSGCSGKETTNEIGTVEQQSEIKSFTAESANTEETSEIITKQTTEKVTEETSTEEKKKIKIWRQYYEDGELKAEYHYNENGQIEKEMLDGSSTGMYIYTYDDNGFLIRKVFYKNGEETGAMYLYTYDNVGNLIKEAEHYDDGSISSWEYIYDGDGNLLKKADDESWEVLEYTYGENGLVQEKTYRGGNWWYYTDYTYDSRGNVIERKRYDADSNRISDWKTYEYDDNGNVLKTIEYDETGEAYEVLEYTYDKEGNLICESGWSHKGERLNEYKNEYEYYE